MTKDKFNIEKTHAGFQFVIPGTEKAKTQSRVKYAIDGCQFIFPGTDKISNKEMLARSQQKPTLAKVAQRNLSETPLFRPSYVK